MKKTGRATMKIDCQTNVKPLWAALLFLAAWLCSASQASADRALLQKVASHPQVAAFRENRARVADNPYRPRYHMSAPDKLMHDPNGLCQWQGRYHLFYQYVVEREGWIVHWGHAYSDDLIHWRDLPAAIKPTVEKSCFSGQTLVEADRVIAMYHGRGAGNMIAVSRDPLLMEWEKLSENPVIPMHTEESPYRVFDPCLWKGEDGAYYSLSGSYRDGEKRIDCLGETHVFRSKNLLDWEWLGPFFTDTLWAERGEDMVVPNFWPVGNGKHLLLCFSHKRGGRGYVGKLDRSSMRFHADYHFRANRGEMRHASIHAPSATLDDQGRYVAIFNMKEARGIKHEGWDGIMSLPRVYSLAEDHSLRVRPVEEAERLRADHQRIEEIRIKAGHEAELGALGGKSIELIARIDPEASREVGLKVLRSSDDAEYTRIVYAPAAGTLTIDTLHSSQLEGIRPRSPETAPLNLEDGEALELRVFIDRSVIEVFANGRLCLAVRVYPKHDDSRDIAFFAQGGDARLLSLDLWKMKPIWPEFANEN